MIIGDEPIKEAKYDVIGRLHLAKAIAAEIRKLDASSGMVIGILGPWGSGKTSLINLIRNELATEPTITVLDFNPWLFSGTSELVQMFFSEVAEQLRFESGTLNTIADEFERYAEKVAPLQGLPFVGEWIGRVGDSAEALKRLRGKGEGGVKAKRKKVEEKLSELESPVVVVIDDVDRLHTDEIREIFKLVRLTANFPNIIYVVAFDRDRVEQALETDGLPGRAYLEKIVQVAYSIPEIPEIKLRNQIRESILQAMEEIEQPGPFDASRWPDVFEEIILPLIRTMRDVRRYTASLRATVRSLAGQVDLVDVFALEAVRVFLPNVFAFISPSRTALTTPDDGWRPNPQMDDHFRQIVQRLISETEEDHEDVVRSMIRRLFPNGARFVNHNWGAGDDSARWLINRRVAHRHVLDYYLERLASPGLEAFWDAEQAFVMLTDKEGLERFFRSIDPARWEGIIQYLEIYQDEYPVESVVPASIVLLNLLPEIPDRPRSLLDFRDKHVTVRRVVLRLLRRLSDGEATEDAVKKILPEVSTLSERIKLLQLVGHEKDVGHGLVRPEVSQALEADLRDQIRQASPEKLAAESHLLWLLSWVRKTSTAAEPALIIPLEAPLACTLLRSALSEQLSQPLGTRAVSREKRLIWEPLLALVGGEEGVRQLIEACEACPDDPQLAEARDLAAKYLSGWRPDD